jgi:DNA-directed RNA polymerase subunit K/omega
MRINVAAQRARQIMQGAAPKLQSQSRKPAAIAIQEVDDGLVEAFTPAELPEPEEVFEEEATEEDEEF